MLVRGDGELLSAWQAGDASAGEAFVDRHFDAITRFFRNKVCGEDDVAELVGQTFLGCTAGKDRWRGEAGARQFLYAIAGNVLRKHIRGRYKRRSEELDFAAVCVQDCDGASMSSIVAHKREARSLAQALREIPVDDQLLLELKYFENLSSDAIAEVLSITATAMPGRTARAKHRLQERLTARLGLGLAGVQHDRVERWAGEALAELRRQRRELWS